jgi:RNA polymerase sigma-70 factor (ECF subfamily)
MPERAGERRPPCPARRGLRRFLPPAVRPASVVDGANFLHRRRSECGDHSDAGMSRQSDDQALVERAQQGDSTGFDLLVTKYQHKIVQLVRRYVHDPQEAQDVAQEAFLKAYRALPNFRGDSAFYTWLYRIAINTAKNHLVAARRRPMDYDFDPQDQEQYDIQGRLRDVDTPEGMALAGEIRQTIELAMEELPEDLRTAIVLRELEGLSYEEIATAMECPVGTVRSRIFRAREAIARHLEPLL